MKKSSIVIIILALAVLLGGVGIYALVKNDTAKESNSVNDAMEKEDGESMEKDNDAMEKDDDGMAKPESSVGSYIAYVDYTSNKATHDKGDVVLFFRASWCPTCKALDKDINANLSSIPSGTTIVDVDYDDSSDLKKKYGVTYQHTLVQVDAEGNQIKKWSGSPTLSELVEEIS